MPLSETILVLMALLTAAMIAAGICRNTPLPFTVFLVIIGVSLGEAARTTEQFEPLLAFQLTPEMVLFLFLPALIFESAFNLNARQLIKNLAPVMVLAIPALLISTALIGVGLWTLLGIDLLIALLFGALISATDPVAVIALFKELGAPQRLTVLVEGESLLNDATAIVLFHILLGLVIGGTLTAGVVAVSALEFVRVFAGGIVIGAVVGMVLSELLYRLKVGVSAYLVMSIVLAYASFTIAEHQLNVSGVMAVVAAAITMGAFGVSRIPQPATLLITETWEVIALVCNSLLFLLVGLSIDIEKLFNRIDMALLAVALMLLARAATVYTLVPATTRFFRLPFVSMGERHIMWWGGLKGGLAIAIVLSIPEQVAGRDLLLDLTLGAVMFTLLVNATTIKPLIQFLGINRLTADERSELKHLMELSNTQTSDLLEKLQRLGLISGATRHLVASRCEQIFAGSHAHIDRRQDIRYLYREALRTEQAELKRIYDSGFIQNYIYLDIRTMIQQDREKRLDNPRGRHHPYGPQKRSIFLRLEQGLIARMRELDWTAGLLARYQYVRFSQSLQRDIAGVMTASAVLEMLDAESGHDADQLREVRGMYQQRLDHRREHLRQVALEFPEFFKRFELHLFTGVAMVQARHHAEEALQRGEIGSKAFAQLERRIHDTLAALPPISDPTPELSAEQLLTLVPLFSGLPPAVINGLSAKADAMTFLARDVVIGEGEHGDALYIIIHGRAAVSLRGEHLADLSDGDFFGEMGVLGEVRRSASVTATTPLSVLRLRRHDIQVLEAHYPQLGERLESARALRREELESRMHD